MPKEITYSAFVASTHLIVGGDKNQSKKRTKSSISSLFGCLDFHNKVIPGLFYRSNKTSSDRQNGKDEAWKLPTDDVGLEPTKNVPEAIRADAQPQSPPTRHRIRKNVKEEKEEEKKKEITAPLSG